MFYVLHTCNIVITGLKQLLSYGDFKYPQNRHGISLIAILAGVISVFLPNLKQGMLQINIQGSE